MRMSDREAIRRRAKFTRSTERKRDRSPIEAYIETSMPAIASHWSPAAEQLLLQKYDQIDVQRTREK